MTPRINETIFSEALFDGIKKKHGGFKLDGKGEISEVTHPGILKTTLLHKNAPEELVYRDSSSSYNLLAFKSKQQANASYPAAAQFEGLPWDISLFLHQRPTEAVIDFRELGSVYLSQVESFGPVLIPEIYHYTLPIWLDYALSEELWGPSGKWSRFHQRLHTLFANNGLLIDQDFPGYYPLKKESQWLESHGFVGLKTDQAFTLIMTWDFPLTGLIELENLLARGR